MPVEELRQEPMMAHLLDSLEKGKDIGHYGRLVFVMVARHFMSDEEILQQLSRNPRFDEEQARSLLKQVEARGYNPPKRERVLDWMQRQKFPICPDTDDPGQCNVYRNLEFPKEIYDRISDFYQGNSN
jgi:DNA primase large subunit